MDALRCLCPKYDRIENLGLSPSQLSRLMSEHAIGLWHQMLGFFVVWKLSVTQQQLLK